MGFLSPLRTKVANDRFRNRTLLWLPLNRNKHSGGLWIPDPVKWTGRRALFRGLAMTVLGKYWRGKVRFENFEIPSIAIVATIFFMLAHMNFTVSPFAITHFSLYQQFLSFGLGLFEAIVFYRTGSLLGPIIFHAYSNTIASVVLYSMAFLLG